MKESVKVTLIISATIIVLALMGLFVAMNLIPSSNTITANGMATIKANPDVITIYFNIETNGSTATIAKDENSKISETFTNALIAKGIAEERIQTQNYNIYPWQEWINNKPVDRGYKASNQVKIELNSSEVNSIGDIIDVGVDSGAIINSINFELSKTLENEYKAQALKQAGEDAKTKAEATASGVGKSLGKLVSVTASDFNSYPWPVYSNQGGSVSMEAASAKLVTTRISPGAQDVSAQVSVVYALK